MAARGLTGQVVAARLLDRLSQMQTETVSNRAASSYANNWGDDIKVEIPETGVSIGQLYDYLRRWLGHETRISARSTAMPMASSRWPRGSAAIPARPSPARKPISTR